MKKTAAIRSTRIALATVLGAAMVSACGGGGGDTAGVAVSAPAASVLTTRYPASVVPGIDGPQLISYTAGDSTRSASVSVATASLFLKVGSTAVVSEHRETSLSDLDVVCVSGHGESTNVVTRINLGVVSKSAAVLMGSGWSAVDAGTAWNRAVRSATAWSGWENCGVKPEGLPSRSSQLTPTVDGGYVEDVFDGNPSTTFLSIRRVVSAVDMAAQLSEAGQANAEQPSRPLLIRMRAFADSAGHTVFIQTGVPAPAAPTGVEGFVALYLPG